jgi:hypothetical protein
MIFQNGVSGGFMKESQHGILQVYHELNSVEACGKNPMTTSLIRNPLPQYDARVKPNMAMMTTEQAAGTA